MTKLIFYPIGNADSTLIELADGRLVLLDYCNRPLTDKTDKRVRLDDELRSYLSKQRRQDINVVAFSHLDDDHVHAAEEFFWFEHAKQYQGEARIRMAELHVPACVILDDEAENSAKVIKAEARYRFKKGSGIRVYGDPEPLEDWLRKQGINPDDRRQLIVKAGTFVPGFSRTKGQVEIFVHSPFSFRMEGETIDRNDNTLVWHLTFFEGDRQLRCLLGADATCEVWSDIVGITKSKGNLERLKWDLFRISHHCSYLSLSKEKGKDETTPWPAVAYLLRLGSEQSVLISSSDPIPTDDTDQPPHRQAAAHYRRVARDHGDEDNFLVTMEYPSVNAPKPLTIEVTDKGLKVQKRLADVSGISTIISRPSPRVG